MSEDLKLYKMGKYVRNVGIMQLIGCIIIPVIIFLILISKTGLFGLYFSWGFVILSGVFIITSLIFMLLMIIRGFVLSRASRNDKYEHFSILTILSYGSVIFFAFIFSSLLSIFTKPAINNLETGISMAVTYSTINASSLIGIISSTINMVVILIRPIGWAFLSLPITLIAATSIMLIVAWLRLRSALKETSDNIQVHKATNGSILMIIAIIFQGIFSTLIFVSMLFVSISLIVTEVFIIVSIAFLILQFSAYIIIGQNLTKVKKFD